ncbi:MAG: uracil-DNA glycosylase [Burkholderiales bacterium]|nr:uracil-DNA glycosylase [Burkholderiales bacterium]
MNESQRRAFDALDLGPRWRARAAGPVPGDAAPAQAAQMDAGQIDTAGVDEILAGMPLPAPATTHPAGPVAQAAEPQPTAVQPRATATQPQTAEPQAAASSGVAAMGWDELRQAVVACRACGLCKTRTQTVFGVGNTQARWLLIGEAPGAEEDRRGEPFVGAAGKLLDSMLASLDLTRERDVYIANVLKCRPPQNRNPAPDEVAHCDPFLRRQVALLDPGLIIVMGRFAAQSLLQTEASIASLRGRVHRYANGERSIPVIVTYHPAYLLRNLSDKARAWADLCLARRTMPAR